MQYCQKCRVNVLGISDRCPLCHGRLKGTGDEKDNIFPVVEKPSNIQPFLFKTLFITAIALGVLCVGINALVTPGVWWSLFVIAGIGSAVVSISVGILKKSNIMKNIIWQLSLVLVLAIAWDISTGWHRWSINHVFPYCCIGVMLLMPIVARWRKIPVKEYVAYLILDVIFGIIPLIFLGTKMLTVKLPSLICIMGSIFSLLILIFFEGNSLQRELKKRMNI